MHSPCRGALAVPLLPVFRAVFPVRFFLAEYRYPRGTGHGGPVQPDAAGMPLEGGPQLGKFPLFCLEKSTGISAWKTGNNGTAKAPRQGRRPPSITNNPTDPLWEVWGHGNRSLQKSVKYFIILLSLYRAECTVMSLRKV